MNLENEIKLEKSKTIFKHFMDVTFGELGILVVKEPQEVQLRVLSVGGERIELDQSAPKDILSQISTKKSIKLPNESGEKVYNEFTSFSVDDQFSSFDPVPAAVLEFTRNGDTVLVFSGKEGGLNYAKILVLDAGKNRKNMNYGWFKFDSSLIDKIMSNQNRD